LFLFAFAQQGRDPPRRMPLQLRPRHTAEALIEFTTGLPRICEKSEVEAPYESTDANVTLVPFARSSPAGRMIAWLELFRVIAGFK